MRRTGFSGAITLIGDEAHRPYDRPPLSKQFLNGDWDAERLHLVQPEKWDELNVSIRESTSAIGFDLESKTVSLSNGDTASADAVVIATGARPRTLPRVDELDGVHVLRTLDEAAMLRSELAVGPKNVVVIGAGFIGAEAAATARQGGHTVTVIEAAAVPMERGLGPTIGTLCGELHREEGVDLRLSTGVAALVGESHVRGSNSMTAPSSKLTSLWSGSGLCQIPNGSTGQDSRSTTVWSRTNL